VNNGWPMIPLGELMADDKTSVNPLNFREEQFELLSIPAFDAGRPELVNGSEIGSSKSVVKAGDVLLSKIVPHIRRAWIVLPASGLRMLGSSEWIVFRTTQTDPGYLKHFLISDLFHAQFMATVSGVGGSLLRARPAYVAEIEIPVPPIEEQLRIAAILDKADEIRTKRRAALAQLDTLTQAIFLDLFGDPVSNPKGWPDRRVDGALDFLTYGHRFYDQSYSDEGTPIVRITDLNESGDLDFPSMPRMAITEQERLTYRVNAGDLLFARSGATVGKVALLREGDPECVGGAYFIWMRFTDEVNPEYARSVLTSDRVRELIVKQSRQAAQQNFSGPAIRRLPMPIPPADLQTQYAEIIQCVSTQKELLSGGLASANDLFASLQHRAFRGEL
jgi:type I restriction enzyme, S subunit